MNKTCNIDSGRRAPGGCRRAVCAATLILAGIGVAARAQTNFDARGADPATEAFPGATGDWPEGDTVRELLRVDAQAALASSRTPRQAADWLGPSAPDGRPPAGHGRAAGDTAEAPADHIDLLAIYGVGNVLQADVSVNGVVSRYRSGRALPLASSTGRAQGYTLQAIKAPCVQLQKAGQGHTVCLVSPEVAHD